MADKKQGIKKEDPAKPVRVAAGLGQEGRERAVATAKRLLKRLPENHEDEEGCQTPSDEN